MRVASVILSLLLHAALALGGLWAAGLDSGARPAPRVYTVDLVRLERVTARPTIPRPLAARTRENPSPPAAVAAARPVPSAAPVAPSAPPSPPAAAPAVPAAPPEPPAVAPPAAAPAGAEAVALPWLQPPAPDPEPPAPREDPTRALARASATQRGDTTYVTGLHGFAAFADTFALDACGADTYVPEDYFGHYAVGRDRVVSVIDGREAHGAFVLYDSASGLHRKLARRGEMVFTYGPAFDQAEPVEGSVTILPKKDRYGDKLILTPAQLVWLPERPPMQYGTRVVFEQVEVAVDAPGASLAGTLVRLPGGGPAPGVVLVHCADCAGRERMLGFAQALALHGLAVLACEGRGCAQGRGPAPPQQQADDALAALRTLRAQPGVDGGRAGLWGQGGGAAVAALAAARSVAPDFLVLAHLPPAPGAAPGPPLTLDGVQVPTLALFMGPRPGELWAGQLDLLARAERARPGQFAARLLPDAPPGADPDAEGLKPPGLRLGRAAGPWVRGARP